MSNSKTQAWLLANNKYTKENVTRLTFGKAKTISVASGKGGVGKTSISLKFSKTLSKQGYKVLLIDCDYNLSNTAIKLGLPLNNDFYKLITSRISLDECLHKQGKFHLLSACSGNIEMFEEAESYSRHIINLINKCEDDYDYIILDSPAGLNKDILTLNAYCDDRFIVVTPDRSSITDSYSLLKILNKNYGIKENHLIVNKISTQNQFNRLVKSLSETVDSFLSCRLKVLGAVELETMAVDLFDKLLTGKKEKFAFDNNFIKMVKIFTEEYSEGFVVNHDSFASNKVRHDVQTTIS
ncbi:MAG: AAA family ATPase [Bacteriovoracaceae bacterium]|jgi:flagellar biosynthesis protein FlhG|nr:AAA family ATPase [Bacteriovoracaceae bacterium]